MGNLIKFNFPPVYWSPALRIKVSILYPFEISLAVTLEINNFFDTIINEVNLDKEIKNLIIYKKALYNADFETENNLINILQPVINSNSVWKSHALYLIAEYFFDKNEKQKAKDFYNQILNFEKSNESIVIETQKRLNRDFSE